MPESTPFSLNVPLPLLMYSLFGCVSLLINKSGQPSWFASRTAIPRLFELMSYSPAFCVASSNVPSPLLCQRRTEVPLYDSGVQYDLALPSSSQEISVAGDHCT